MVKTREGHRATMYVSKQLSAEGTSETGAMSLSVYSRCPREAKAREQGGLIT